MLDRYARAWIDLQQTRKALAQREIDEKIVAEFEKVEKQVSTRLSKTLRSHRLWPWLSQFPGLGGAHTALVIGRIGDPRRYPGQRCSEGHYLAPLYKVGAVCPVTLAAEVAPATDSVAGGEEESLASGGDRETDARCACKGTMREARTTTGVSSLWHWAGLHVVDGRAPTKRRGVQADWEPRVRASVMQPGGIAEQIVRLGVPRYVDIYRAAKERLVLRVVETPTENETVYDDATEEQRVGEGTRKIELAPARPLRLFEADRIARKIAAKAFLGDLLVEWKRISA